MTYSVNQAIKNKRIRAEKKAKGLCISLGCSEIIYKAGRCERHYNLYINARNIRKNGKVLKVCLNW